MLGQSIAPTEQINPNTAEIDLLPTEAVLRTINQADQEVAVAVEKAIPQIALVVDKIIEAFNQGGRLFYIGAGTSGRLGVLDASECPPTFGVDPELVQGIIAGGDIALRSAVEGAEDDPDAGKKAILDHHITEKDVVIGLSASGGAAFVVEAIKTATSLGAFTGAITCYGESLLAHAADVAMVADVGPEVLAGSTRMKAGTAQKLILNMLTTGAMIGWGKTYRNLMVDLKPTNIKLKARAIRLVSLLSEKSPTEAEAALGDSKGRVKHATVMLAKNISYPEAEALLSRHHGKLRAVLEEG